MTIFYNYIYIWLNIVKNILNPYNNAGLVKKHLNLFRIFTTKLNNSGKKTTNDIPGLDELMERFRALQTNNNEGTPTPRVEARATDGDIPDLDELMERFRALQTDDAEGLPYREGGKTRKRKTRKRKTRKRKTRKHK